MIFAIHEQHVSHKNDFCGCLYPSCLHLKQITSVGDSIPLCVSD